MKVKLTIAYDGTAYAGWQLQANAGTIQHAIEKALHEFTGRRIPVAGAGRTDAGVHARGQVAHAVLPERYSTATIQRALNALLPRDILILSVQAVSDKFHARYDAREKWYRYSIWNRPLRPVFDRHLVHHVPEPLDVAAMRRACAELKGRRDFKAFHTSGRTVSSTVRTLCSLTIKEEKGMIHIDAKADGFLYHMVRRIAGLLIEVGKGKPLPAIPPTAPARGLCLMKVSYR